MYMHVSVKRVHVRAVDTRYMSPYTQRHIHVHTYTIIIIIIYYSHCTCTHPITLFSRHGREGKTGEIERLKMAEMNLTTILAYSYSSLSISAQLYVVL